MFIASAVPFIGWFQRSTARAGGDNSRFISSLVAACEELCSENQRQVWAGNVMLCCTRLCTWRVVSTCERSERRLQIRRSHTAPGHRLQLPDDEKLIPPSPQLLLGNSICKGRERDGVKVRLSSLFLGRLSILSELPSEQLIQFSSISIMLSSSWRRLMWSFRFHVNQLSCLSFHSCFRHLELWLIYGA